MCQDFVAPNPDRLQRACCWRTWGKLMGVCRRLLVGQRRSCSHGYMSEGRPGLLGSLLGMSFVGMAVSGVATLRHSLVGFWLGWSLQLQYPLDQARGDGGRALWERKTLRALCWRHHVSTKFLQCLSQVLDCFTISQENFAQLHIIWVVAVFTRNDLRRGVTVVTSSKFLVRALTFRWSGAVWNLITASDGCC